MTYYNCLSLPQELEMLIFKMKDKLEYKDNLENHKKKSFLYLRDISLSDEVAYEELGFYYDDAIGYNNALECYDDEEEDDTYWDRGERYKEWLREFLMKIDEDRNVMTFLEVREFNEHKEKMLGVFMLIKTL